ncbi:OmpA family protein [Yoonia sp. 2307UL14-13]|uniref:OmpA family protein n=1 Tax=Yoonia sp. 2307UL14-13 TaxID=3126506 RepID=UPI00309DEF67
MILLLIIGYFLWASNAEAMTLNFPSNASLQREVTGDLDSYALPIGIWDKGVMPTEVVEGQMTRQAWRIGAQSLTTLQMLRPLREQLRNDRFRVIFECQTEACGGFDFRFGTKTLPPPEMQINLGDFRFLAARRIVEGGTEYVSLFVSKTAQAGFVQVTRVGPPEEDAAPLVTTTAPALRGGVTTDASGLVQKLEAVGHAVLDDLQFETGSSQLGEGPFASLDALADHLAATPDLTVALVGHTDASGSLDANIALSKRRAATVLERLVSEYGITRTRLAAEGMGYLAPIDSNATDEGRDANRRVEVIVTSIPD